MKMSGSSSYNLSEMGYNSYTSSPSNNSKEVEIMYSKCVEPIYDKYVDEEDEIS